MTHQRIARWEALSGSQWNPASEILPDWIGTHRVVVAPISSRVGLSHDVHRALAKQLIASERETTRLIAIWLSSAGTAIDPWLVHAAAALQVDLVRSTPSFAIDADTWAIAAADRVEALRIRPGGKTEKLLLQRLKMEPGSVVVAIDERLTPPHVSNRLLDAGAIGRFAFEEVDEPAQESFHDDAPIWHEDPSSWLVHCTRAIVGPWPGQSWRRYRDDLLVGSADPIRDVCQTLCRIVRTRCIVGSAIASRHSDPVVCFSAVNLSELLSRRRYRSHLKRWDYEPWGVAIRKEVAEQIGMQPVVYGDTALYDSLPSDQRFRYAAAGKSGAWTEEQEWRHHGSLDLSSISSEDLRVFVPDQPSAARVAKVNAGQWPIRIVKSQHE